MEIWTNKGKKTTSSSRFRGRAKSKHGRNVSVDNTILNKFRRHSGPEITRDERDITSYNNDTFDVESPLSPDSERSLRIFSRDQHRNDISSTLGNYHEVASEEDIEHRINDFANCSRWSPRENIRRVEIYMHEEDNRTEHLRYRRERSYERSSDHLGYNISGVEENVRRNNQSYNHGENESRENSYRRFKEYNERESEIDEYQRRNLRRRGTREESSERLQVENWMRESINRSDENSEERKDDGSYNYYRHEERMQMREISNRHIEQTPMERLEVEYGRYAKQSHGEIRNGRSYEVRNKRDEIDIMERWNQRHDELRMERKVNKVLEKTEEKNTMKRKGKYSEKMQMVEKKNKLDSPEQIDERGLRKKQDKRHKQHHTHQQYNEVNITLSYRSFCNLTVDKKKDIVSVILSACIQSNNEHLPLQSLSDSIKERMGIEFKRKSDLLRVLRGFPKCFSIDSNKKVTASTDVHLCHKKNCDCEKLHICKYDLRNACRFGDRCEFGHALHSEKNANILEKHFLHKMDDSEIKALLRFVGHRTIPSLCIYYRKGDCNKWKECTRLHLCLNFIKGDCKYGHKCKKSHDLRSERAEKILRQHGLYEEDDCTLLQLIRGTLDESGKIKVDLKAPLITKAKAIEPKKRKFGDDCSQSLSPSNKKMKIHPQNESGENFGDLQTKLNTTDYKEKDMELCHNTILENDSSGSESEKRKLNGSCSQACSDSGDRRNMQKTIQSLDFIPLTTSANDFTMKFEDGESNQSEELIGDVQNTKGKAVKVSFENKKQKQSLFAHYLSNLSKKSTNNNVLNSVVASMSKCDDDESDCSVNSSYKTKTDLPENGKDVTVEDTLQPQLGNNSEHADKTFDTTKLKNETIESLESIKDKIERKAGDVDISKTEECNILDKVNPKCNDSIVEGSPFQALVPAPAVINLPDKPHTADSEVLNLDESDKKEIIASCTSAMPDADLHNNIDEQIDIKMSVGSEEYFLKATKNHLELKTGLHSRTFTDESVIQWVINLLEFCKQNHE